MGQIRLRIEAALFLTAVVTVSLRANTRSGSGRRAYFDLSWRGHSGQRWQRRRIGHSAFDDHSGRDRLLCGGDGGGSGWAGSRRV